MKTRNIAGLAIIAGLSLFIMPKAQAMVPESIRALPSVGTLASALYNQNVLMLSAGTMSGLATGICAPEFYKKEVFIGLPIFTTCWFGMAYGLSETGSLLNSLKTFGLGMVPGVSTGLAIKFYLWMKGF